jgi:multidrug efflux pump
VNLSTRFIERPIATTLLTVGLALAGVLAFFKLPVSPLPKVDFPTIVVQAQMPGASPETMAASVAAPLERHLGVIANVNEMTSQSTVGSTRVVLQFGLERNIDGAARDVQAAINAARADLPTSLRQNPTYRKANPADAPIIILALTSDTLTRGQMYDVASTVLQPALSQIDGVGQVVISGSSLPAVRVELNPLALFKYGIGLEDVRAAVAASNAHSPKGAIEDGDRRYQLATNDQANQAADYRPLVVAYRNGAPVRLIDVGEVVDSVENLRNEGVANGEPAVLVILYRQPGSNIIDVADRVSAVLPQVQASLPSAINVHLAIDRTTTIRASLHDVERTLVIAIGLVMVVVFLFLRSARTSFIPSLAVPLSLLGTFGGMYLFGYSLDNLSLMALTVCTGFVVDDAIVVVENVARHIEAGMPRRLAALQGAREVGFTVLSMSVSLIAVFLPILLMGGIIGRLFREFAMVLSIAILISLVLSLTTTPMMCAYIIRQKREPEQMWLLRAAEAGFRRTLDGYDRSLVWALRHPWLVMLVLLATLCFNIYLFVIIPKGFFPNQDTGLMVGGIQADQSISFQLMKKKLYAFEKILRQDPAIANVTGFTGNGQTNSGFVFVALKPLADRKVSLQQVMGRLRPKLNRIPGARLYLQPVQDIRVGGGGRQSNAQYQYTLQADDVQDLYRWGPIVESALQRIPMLTEVNLDLQQKGREIEIIVDRASAARLGISISQIDNTLYDSFGQRQVSVIYNPRNQYHVVMEVAPEFWQAPETLDQIYVSTGGGAVAGTQSTNAPAGTVVTKAQASKGNATLTAAQLAADAARNQATNALANTSRGATSTGTAVSTSRENMVPLSAFSHFGQGDTPLSVNHHGLFVASTISFNLAPGASLSDATAAIEGTVRRLGLPTTIQAQFQGAARVFKESLANEPILIAAAVLAVYIVLGVLYESYVHPITILSTLPSAGVGAILALMLFRTEFSIMALIGVILLIGIVKKNAIMMIDFALDAERRDGLSSRDAIYRACLQRFRPIMMTTMAAMLGAVPLAIGFGEGSELRRPLGLSIIGGLMLSQALTLYTTPVIYLHLDRFRLWAQQRWTSLCPRPRGDQFHAPEE